MPTHPSQSNKKGIFSPFLHTPDIQLINYSGYEFTLLTNVDYFYWLTVLTRLIITSPKHGYQLSIEADMLNLEMCPKNG